ncbi:MAG: retropepsin-like aspartic protease [Chloroflexota bacterium]
MRIDGAWLPDEPGILRPTLFGLVEISGREYPVQFLVDTGADQTILGSDFATRLQPRELPEINSQLSGAAGNIDAFYASIRLRFSDVDEREIKFNLTCAVLTDPAQANTHLLGRDVLDHFALICDKEKDVVALLRPPHSYSIAN